MGTISHHQELKDLNDVDNGVGVVEYWGGKIACFFCSRTQAHGRDVCTEVIGTEGKVIVNLVPRIDNVTVAQTIGISHKVQPEYWERFEDAFAMEVNEFVGSIVNNTPVPLKLELGLISLKIGWALQEALLTGERIRFNEKGEQIDGGRGRLRKVSKRCVLEVACVPSPNEKIICSQRIHLHVFRRSNFLSEHQIEVPCMTTPRL